MLGRGNEMLGGLGLTQTRASTSSRTCSSRFTPLVSSCQGHLPNSDSRASAKRLLPFGLDPAFNPLSRMFSAEAAQSEEQYYNSSEGSPELSPEGFPLAFFPRTVKGKPKFIIVFPVRHPVPELATLSSLSFFAFVNSSWYLEWLCMLSGSLPVLFVLFFSGCCRFTFYACSRTRIVVKALLVPAREY